MPPLFRATRNTTLHELQTGDTSRATDTNAPHPWAAHGPKLDLSHETREAHSRYVRSASAFRLKSSRRRRMAVGDIALQYYARAVMKRGIGFEDDAPAGDRFREAGFIDRADGKWS